MHFIDEYTDAGFVFSHTKTSFLNDDIFNKLAKKHYRNELNNLINFEKYLWNGKTFDLQNNKSSKPNKRMPEYIEKKLKFYLKNYFN